MKQKTRVCGNFFHWTTHLFLQNLQKKSLDDNSKKSSFGTVFEKVKSCCTESGEHGTMETISVYTFTLGVLLILLAGDVREKNKVHKFVLSVSVCITLFGGFLFAFAKKYPCEEK